MTQVNFDFKTLEEVAGPRGTRFVWVDEDEAQVSPIHNNLGTAMNFYTGWHKRWQTAVRRWGEPGLGYSSGHPFVSLTRSGKPPKELKRIDLNPTINDLSEAEATVIAALKETQ